MSTFERSLSLLNVTALVGALEKVPCPDCRLLFEVRPTSPEWQLTTPAQRACGTCTGARSALAALTGAVGWPSPFKGIFHERRAARVLDALGPEWASAYRYAAWLEEAELESGAGGSAVCRAADTLLAAIEDRLAEAG